ncbi:Glucose-repressible alcohol dehydrogenase transcriptional effector [Verticillium nonalfalfae]|uniref:CCR4-Not complex 3'-5'-exoribonuclease subunit Ccr4 n=1 Tax=Verticillium nonalfalfae TaxID=1051616 RepID=A0A3M9YFB3_9PEZI|nr:Glucose-repressible alcohol dehydrogenase transcriptional effector [Verticillium nonalfalfae]RNJ58268.1 Glucose-repressible alcohol dehydrogenase transcriptional effector [Verticillium nonalfalfae]
MFSQNHQQGHNSRMNGTLGGQRMPVQFNYQQGQHHQQGHVQHHQPGQQDHAGHNGNGPVLGHHSSYSSGVMSSASPFTNAMQNGHTSTTRGGQAQPISEHWAEQLRMHKEAERAHTAMTDQNQPHYYARLKAAENKGIGYPSPPSGKNPSGDTDTDDRRRPYSVEKARGPQAWHNLDMSGQGLRNLTPALFAYTFLSELYIASNKIAHLPASIGQLRQLRLLEASYNQIEILPPELGMCTYMKELLLFNNQIKVLPFELGSMHLLEQLGLEGNPLDATQKSTLAEKGTKTLIHMLKEKGEEPPEPIERKFVTIQEDVNPSLERIKVLSWNVLCDKYATPQTYGYTPSEPLGWEYRKKLIYKEIGEKRADFLCLQEISTEAFKEEFSPELAKYEYRGVQWPKTRAKTMNERDALGVDGCATFFNASKFILLDKHVVEFATIAINRPDMKNQHDVFNRVMPKDNIAVVIFLESRQTGARFILVNGHLAWESVLADVKLIQTGILMEQVAKLAERWVRMPAVKDKKPFAFSGSGDKASPVVEPAPSQEYRNVTDIPLLVCGDFNSTLDSSVYELLAQGRVSPDHKELASFQYGNFTRDGIEHPFSLRDAYAPTHGTPDQLPYTNYTPGFTDVIDYLWFSTNTLEVVDLLGPPDAEYLKRVPAFPHWHFPSDHMQIMAEFVVKARKDKKAIVEPDFGSGSGSGGGKR